MSTLVIAATLFVLGAHVLAPFAAARSAAPASRRRWSLVALPGLLAITIGWLWLERRAGPTGLLAEHAAQRTRQPVPAELIACLLPGGLLAVFDAGLLLAGRKLERRGFAIAGALGLVVVIAASYSLSALGLAHDQPGATRARFIGDTWIESPDSPTTPGSPGLRLVRGLALAPLALAAAALVGHTAGGRPPALARRLGPLAALGVLVWVALLPAELRRELWSSLDLYSAGAACLLLVVHGSLQPILARFALAAGVLLASAFLARAFVLAG